MLGVTLGVALGVADPLGTGTPLMLKLSTRNVLTVKTSADRRQQKPAAPPAAAGSTPVEKPRTHAPPAA